MFYSQKKKKKIHQIIVKCRWRSEFGVSSAAGSWWSPGQVPGGVKPLKMFDLSVSGGQMERLKRNQAT